MNALLNGIEEHLILSEHVPAMARNYIQQAIDCYEDTERAESLLLHAHQLAPDDLNIYISIYKFYFYKKHLTSAEHFADMTLTAAAKQGVLNADWVQLDVTSCNWNEPTHAQRVYLYTLKALGFIYLRTERLNKANIILNKLLELDINDLVGGSVVMSLAQNLLEDDDAVAA